MRRRADLFPRPPSALKGRWSGGMAAQDAAANGRVNFVQAGMGEVAGPPHAERWVIAKIAWPFGRQFPASARQETRRADWSAAI